MYYPIMLNINNKSCIVVGGGKVALRKTTELIKCNAKISIISPEISEEFIEKFKANHITYIKSNYNKQLLREAVLCFACTDNQELNKKIAEDARALNIAVNVSDSPELSTFIVPAVRRKEDITLAITANENPAASRYVADLTSDQLEDWLLKYISMTGNFRKMIKEKLTQTETRQELMRALFSEEFINIAKLSTAEAEHEANILFEKIIRKAGI